MQRMLVLQAIAIAVCASSLMWAQTDSIKPIPGTGSLTQAAGSKFKFIVAGDNRPQSADQPQPKTPGQIFQAAKDRGVAFVVWTGDTIYGLDSADPDIVGKQYQEFFSLAATAGVPVFTAPGNHEMDVKVKQAGLKIEVGSAAMEKLYRKNMGIEKHGAIYGAFTYGNARFILLNSEEIPPDGVVRSETAPDAVAANGVVNAKGKVKLDPGFIGPDQIQWLTAELAANKATHTFVFMHHPIKPMKASSGLNKENANALVSLFAKYSNISYVMASHEHLYYNAQTGDMSPPPNRTAPSQDPPYYLISGGAGAPLDDGGFYHYLVVTVDGNNIQVEMVRLPAD